LLAAADHPVLDGCNPLMAGNESFGRQLLFLEQTLKLHPVFIIANY
jgi:hypothetical protein